MRAVMAFACGLVFSAGLILSDMVNPARVQAFLDIGGAWDPTLAFVMGGAVCVAALGWALARGRRTAVLGGPLPGPPAGRVDGRLALGAVLFGVGWGLVGFCPGPALAALGAGRPEPWIFAAAMLAGMLGWQMAAALRGRSG
ncbi:hypothetical protein FDP22_17510 [Paroceanicella profunda]|uniref:YeeE/YedE family protein n=1 Tax=Paroceanicella profunda TaxID=2579971 RepID=A0A5B8FZ89_9RHOB|nr:hypothetical protein FDP22_17510 [Paroceanicella profunda]